MRGRTLNTESVYFLYLNFVFFFFQTVFTNVEMETPASEDDVITVTPIVIQPQPDYPYDPCLLAEVKVEVKAEVKVEVKVEEAESCPLTSSQGWYTNKNVTFICLIPFVL